MAENEAVDDEKNPRHIGYSGRAVPELHRSSLFTCSVEPNMSPRTFAGNLSLALEGVKPIQIAAKQGTHFDIRLKCCEIPRRDRPEFTSTLPAVRRP